MIFVVRVPREPPIARFLRPLFAPIRAGGSGMVPWIKRIRSPARQQTHRRPLPNTLALNSWDHWSRYRTAIRHDLALYPLVGHSQTIRQRLGRLPAELLFY